MVVSEATAMCSVSLWGTGRDSLGGDFASAAFDLTLRPAWMRTVGGSEHLEFVRGTEPEPALTPAVRRVQNHRSRSGGSSG